VTLDVTDVARSSALACILARNLRVSLVPARRSKLAAQPLIRSLFVIAHATDQIAYPRHESDLPKFGCVGTRFWSHIGHFCNLTFWLLCCRELFQPIQLARRVLNCVGVRTNWSIKRTGYVFAIADSRAERIQVSVPEAAFALVEQPECAMSRSAFTAAAALSSIALASSAVPPDSPCCSKAYSRPI
jgi:hypothetical protein